MANITQLVNKDGVEKYPITKTQAVLDENGNTLDGELTNLQPKTDNTLTTTSKNIVGAINELDSDKVEEAPIDTKEYVRKDGEWVENSGGEVGIPEAPTDGKTYGRKNADWEEVKGEVQEAPKDGKIYGRKSGTWEEVKNEITEAPDDGKTYGRKNKAWEEVPIITSEEKALWNNKANKIVQENVAGNGNISIALESNHFYVYGAITGLTITALNAGTEGVYNEYMIQFKVNSESFTLVVPDTIKWADGSDPTSIENGKTYQISIVNNLATLLGGEM